MNQFNAAELSAQTARKDALNDDVGLDQDSERDYSRLEENQIGFLKVAKCIESKNANLRSNSVNIKAKNKLQLE
jgi:hypothetical protein